MLAMRKDLLRVNKAATAPIPFSMRENRFRFQPRLYPSIGDAANLLRYHGMKAGRGISNATRVRRATITHYLLVQRYEDVYSALELQSMRASYSGGGVRLPARFGGASPAVGRARPGRSAQYGACTAAVNHHRDPQRTQRHRSSRHSLG